ncbi:transcriptional regulator, HxlR family [Maribacter sedimenticola]|uniref:Transcriptional regulator, HxlR family n=1 Tax=Maribacter sedimenticola TaxID=228956 RepID=A0ABY1SGX9_9FLAO|nr:MULTISPECIES: helix-turn-helix domain-containing protein [Maribacter]TVZ14198.1 HxlR family transcriptional regulator [Maribacter sp. MAR_2009_72]SNR47530.1 transcriptional regulator, HxlR family [Maribacter sedimenticola]
MSSKKYCPLDHTMNLIGTKWKPIVLFHLLDGPLRSGVLQKKVPGISNKMFTQTVRELEKDGLVERVVYPVVPPKVEYGLTERGKSLKTILLGLDSWGANDTTNNLV